MWFVWLSLERARAHTHTHTHTHTHIHTHTQTSIRVIGLLYMGLFYMCLCVYTDIRTRICVICVMYMGLFYVYLYVCVHVWIWRILTTGCMFVCNIRILTTHTPYHQPYCVYHPVSNMHLCVYTLSLNHAWNTMDGDYSHVCVYTKTQNKIK